MTNFNKVKTLKEAKEGPLLSIAGVHGIGIGEDKSKPGEFCIYLHVDPLKAAEGNLPGEMEGVKIIVRREKMAMPNADEKTYRPLRGGCQIQPVNGGLGTLGCMVKDHASGKFGILSNKHVLAHAQVLVGQPISGHMIGTITRTSGTSPLVDGAIAEISQVGWEPFILEIGAIEGTYTVTEKDITGMGYPIKKRGRTTGLTAGFITELHYSGTRSDQWQFKDQLYVGTQDFSKPGDSGAVYVDHSNRVVGLNWGSPPNGSFAAGSPIAAVLDVLAISIPTALHKRAAQV